MRQITVLSEESWDDACAELGVEILWKERRANLLLSGHRFSEADVSKMLIIGDSVVLEITGECAPCK